MDKREIGDLKVYEFISTMEDERSKEISTKMLKFAAYINTV